MIHVILIILAALGCGTFLFACGLVWSFRHELLYRLKQWLGEEPSYVLNVTCPHDECGMIYNIRKYSNENNGISYFTGELIVSEYSDCCNACGKEFFYTTEFDLRLNFGIAATSREAIRARYGHIEFCAS